MVSVSLATPVLHSALQIPQASVIASKDTRSMMEALARSVQSAKSSWTVCAHLLAESTRSPTPTLQLASAREATESTTESAVSVPTGSSSGTESA